MRKLILDTNFLLIPFTRKVDIFLGIEKIMDEPYRLFILEETLNELKRIIECQRGKHRDAAKMALQLIGLKKISVLDHLPSDKQKSLYTNLNSKGSTVDDILLGFADSSIIVATQDRGLRRKLKYKGIKVVFLRRNKNIEMK